MITTHVNKKFKRKRIPYIVDTFNFEYKTKRVLARWHIKQIICLPTRKKDYGLIL